MFDVRSVVYSSLRKFGIMQRKKLTERLPNSLIHNFVSLFSMCYNIGTVEQHKEVLMPFSKIPIGACFAMKRGLLWRKTAPTEAIDVWSHRIVQIKPDVICHI